MSEEKDVNKKIDDLEAAKEKYLSENTVISIGGYAFTPAKLMIAAGIVSSVLGGLYGAFEVYKDYMDMKEKIEQYVAPDLSELNKKIAIVEENSAKAVDYTRDIKNDLKNDIRRLEGVVESVERNSKQIGREAGDAVKQNSKEMNEMQKEQQRELRAIRKEVDDKIKKALDNPLAN